MWIKIGKISSILLIIRMMGIYGEVNAASWQWAVSSDFGLARAPAKSEIDWETHPVGWSDDRRLTFDGYGARPYIVSDADALHLVWTGTSKDDPYRYQVYYMKSVDNGRAWSNEEILSNNATGFADVAGFISDTNGLHVIWTDQRDYGEGKEQIYYRKSAAGGITWGPERRLTDTEARCAAPSITSDGAILYVGWCDARTEDFEIYLTCSSDGGEIWTIPRKITDPPHRYNCYNNIIADGGGFHLVWEKWEQDVKNAHIYYKKSVNGGITWTDPQRLTPVRDEYVEFRFPLIRSDTHGLHVVCQEIGLGSVLGWWSRLWYIVSRNGGNTWSEPAKISDFPYSVDFFSHQNEIHLFWTDWSAGKILHSKSSDGGNIWSEGQPLSRVSWAEGGLKAAAANSCLHLIWADERSVDEEGASLYYKFYDPTPPTGRPTKPVVRYISYDETRYWRWELHYFSSRGTVEDPESRLAGWEVQTKLEKGDDIRTNVMRYWYTGEGELPEIGQGTKCGEEERGKSFSARARVFSETYRYSEWSDWSDPVSLLSPSTNIIVYPNPFMPGKGHKSITFANFYNDPATIKIYNLAGEEVGKIEKDETATKVEWQPVNESGKKLASGVYIYHIKSGSSSPQGKIAIIR